MSFFRNLKETIKNPKKKSIILLAFYFVFFIIVFILFGISDSKKSNYVPGEKVEEKEPVYNYKYSIMTGEDVVEQIDEDNKKYKYEVIKELVGKSLSKTTYKDNNKIVYNLDIYEYFKAVGELESCSEVDCENIIVLVTVDKENFEEVIIDLSSFYGYQYEIKIEYSILE